MPSRNKLSWMIGLVTCALFIFAASSVWADETDEPMAPAGAAAVETEPQSEPSATSRAGIEEITVTARRREESLLEIPESIAAFSDVQIDRANISGLSDIGLLVPNLYIGKRTDGFPNVTMRGMGSFGNVQGVGFYLDDVQLFGDSSGRFGDLERIEVLKGPQGVLHGGTNVGGAIKWITKRPDPDGFSGRLRVGAGKGTEGNDGTFFDTEVEVNVPLPFLGETWAARVFVYGEDDEGYLKKRNDPRFSGVRGTADSDIMEMHRYGVRGAIAGDITERLSLFATLRYHEEDGGNDYWGRETTGGSLKFPDTRVNSFNGEHYRETWAWSVQLDYDFDDFTITSITSNTDTDSARESDVDNVQEFVLDLLRIHRIDVVTQELRFTSTGAGPFQWQFGGFYQNYDRDLNGDLYLFGGSGLFQGFADPNFIPDPATETDQGLDFNDPANRDRDDPDAVFLGCSDVTLCDPLVFERSKRQRDSHAVFVNASYRWNAFEFSAGYRADTWESQRYNDDSGVAGKRKQTQNLFRGNVSWFMNDESMFYLTYAQGFEPGDYNLTSFEGVRDLFGYGPERATNYELGYKGRLFDDRVVLTAALFKTDYKDRQAELQLEAPTGEVVEGIINAGDSRNQGWEASVQWLLHPDWTATVDGGVISSEWKSGTTSPVTGRSISGRTPLNHADWSYAVAVDYDRQLNLDTRLFGRAQVRAKGPAATNSQFFDTPDDSFGPWDNDQFTVVDLNLGVEWKQFEFGLRLENIFDEEYYIDIQELANFAGNLFNPGSSQEAILIGTLEQSRRIRGYVQWRF